MSYETVETVEALDETLIRVREAQKIFASYSQEQVDKIFLAAAIAANLKNFFISYLFKDYKIAIKFQS